MKYITHLLKMFLECIEPVVMQLYNVINIGEMRSQCHLKLILRFLQIPMDIMKRYD